MVLYNHSPSDAMQLIGMGELPPPATCMACGSGTCEEGYVNTGVWFEYEGTMLLCVPCLTKLGELAGLRVPAEIKIIEDLNERLNATVQDLEEALVTRNAELESFTSVFRSIGIPNPGVLLRPDDGVNSSTVEIKSDDVGVAEQTSSGTDGGEPEPEKSVKGSGRSNVKRAKLLDTSSGKDTIEL